MYVIPMGWVPWLLALAGAYAVFFEGEMTGLLALAAGVIWLVVKYRGQQA